MTDKNKEDKNKETKPPTIDAQPPAGEANLAEVSHGALQVNVPAYIKPDTRGVEDIERTDLLMPRIAIAQANSPQKKKSDPLYIPGLEEGQLFNTLTNEIYGDRLIVLPLFVFKNRIYFAPYGSGEGILCQSPNAINGGRLHPTDCLTCPHAQFKNDEDDERPDCTNFYNYVSLLPKGSSSPWASVSLKSTDTKEAKQFNTKVRMSGRSMFAKTLELTTISKTKKNNSFYGWVLKPLDWIPEKLYLHAEQKFDELKAMNIQVDTRGLEQEDTNFETRNM